MIESVPFHTRLTVRQHRMLTEESLRTGLPIAELIRRAVDAKYRPNLRPLVKGYHVNFGLFKDPDAAVVGRLTRHPRRIRD